MGNYLWWDFRKRFRTEEARLEYLTKLRWPKGYKCLRCGSANTRKVSSGHYRCRKCLYRCSVLSGTLFHGTHKPLAVWFEAIGDIVLFPTRSAANLQKSLELGSYRTAWKWMQKLHPDMIGEYLSGSVEVKIFDSRNRGKETLILVAVMREINSTGNPRKGKVRLVYIVNNRVGALKKVIPNIVTYGSKIYTNDEERYEFLTSENYDHKSSNRKDATPLADNVIWDLENRGEYRQLRAIGHKNLQSYLDHLTFHMNSEFILDKKKVFEGFIRCTNRYSI